MKGKSSLGGSFSRSDSAGVSSGLTKVEGFESDQTMVDSDFNQDGSGSQGYTRQAKGKRTSSSVSEKGKSMEIC